MLGRINVYTGTNMKHGNHHQFLNSYFLIQYKNKLLRQKVNISEVDSIVEADEESCKSFIGSAAAGLAGMALLGPAGLLAGVLAGGNKKTKVFIVNFKNGSSMLASTDSRTYLNINSELFEYKMNEQLAPEETTNGITLKTIAWSLGIAAVALMYTFY